MYPPISPHDSGMLKVSQNHQVHWESSGNPKGIPVLYLHGGPGAVLRDGHRRHFDPDLYRVIALQQRGVGRSIPSAVAPEHDLADNTTELLIADIEALREHLGIGQWLVFGVSWGSTLALHYAMAHRQHVSGLLLMAVTSTTPEEVAWITEGVGMLYPEAWHQLSEVVQQYGHWSPGQRPLVQAVADIMAGADEEAKAEMALAWMAWEDTHIQIGLPLEALRPVTMCERPIAEQIAFTTLVSHYWSHHAALDPRFVPEGGITAHLKELEGLPLCMVHGRRDVSSPVSIPWNIKRELPEAQLHVVEHEGHGGAHMAELTRRAADSFARSGAFELLGES